MPASSVTKICVFCGSAHGRLPAYANAARALGQRMAESGIGLVYGGGGVGLMGEVAASVNRSGGHVTGVMPHALIERELADPNAHVFEEVATMRDRKERMCELADAFVAMPGGIGTLEELFEVLSLSQLALHNKKIGLLNIDGYFDPLLGFLDHSETEGFIRRGYRDLLVVEADPRALVDALVHVS